MKSYGTLQQAISQPPDAVQTLLLAVGTPQNIDWPGTTASGAGVAGAHIVRFTGFSTAGAQISYLVNMNSTQVSTPTSGSSVSTGTSAGSTGNTIPIFGIREMWIPPYSTGWSVAMMTSGYVMAEVWKRN